MRFECREKVGEILGRKITEAEGKEILGRVRYTYKNLRDSMPGFDALPHDNQVLEAAKVIAGQVKSEARQKADNLRRQAMAQYVQMKQLQRLSEEEDVHAYVAVSRRLIDAENYIKGVTNVYMDRLVNMLNAIDSKWLGLFEDPESARNFIKAAFGEESTQKARDGYKAYKDVNKDQMARAKAAGLQGGELEDYIPQNHDQWKVAEASKVLGKAKGTDNADSWAEFITPLLDREKFLNDDGTLMSDADLRIVLREAYDNIVTNGHSGDPFDFKEIQRQRKSRGGRFKLKHRVLHFKDADSWLAYHEKFGRGSLSQMLMGSVLNLSHTIGMLEKFGPNPENTYRFMKDIAQAESEKMKPKVSGLERHFVYGESVGFTRTNIDNVWKNLTGEANLVESVRGSRVAQDIRNLEVSSKLGKAFITSISDIPTTLIAARFNRIPITEALSIIPRAFGSEWKDYAVQLGIVADSLLDDFNRWGGDFIGQNWSSKVANGVMRASLLTWWTDGIRRGFSLCMMASLGRMAKKSWNMLDDYDRARLVDGGIEEADWETIRQAGTEKFKGLDFLNLQALKNVDMTAASKLVAFVVKESEMASLNPDIVTRSETNRGLKRGTINGEISRCAFLFKTFPISMMEKQWRRAEWLNRHSKVNKWAYLAGIMVATTLGGAFVLQLQQLLNGKDFRDSTSREFWLDSLAKGGGLGFAGDFLADQFSDDPKMGAWGAIQGLGPVASSLFEAGDLAMAARGNAFFGKDKNVEVKAARFARSHMPFVNMWYTSAVIDRAFWNEMQEWLMPGYMRQTERRMQKMYGQGYWWNPMDVGDIRMPEMADKPDN